MPYIDILIGNEYLNKFCSFLLLFILFLNRSYIFKKEGRGGTGFIILLIVTVLYSTFFITKDGDSLASIDEYHAYLNYGQTGDEHFEPVYLKMMDIASAGYLYWRLLVWGVAAIIMLYVMKRIDCDPHLSSLFMCYYCIPIAFYYQRASLAFAILFLGIVLLIEWQREDKRKRKIIKLLLSIGLVFVSYYFHRSMPLYIVIASVVLLVPLSKKTAIVYFVGLIVVSIGFTLFATRFLESGSQEFYESGMNYLDTTQKAASRSFGGLVYEYIMWLPYFGIIVYGLRDLLVNHDSFSRYESFFLTFGAILYFASFLMVSKSSMWFVGKLRTESVFAITIFLIMYFKDRRESKACRVFSISAILSLLLRFAIDLI